MHNVAPPITSLGEDALHRLVARYEDFKLLDEGDTTYSLPGRHTWGQGPEVRRANAVVDIVAICENFATVRILQACPSLLEQDVFTWIKRKNAWLKEFGVDFGKLGTDWEQVEGFIEIRNSLQHGLGRLTDSQLAKRRDAVLGAIRAAGVELNGDRILLTSSDVARCASACTNFALQLDHAAPASS